MYNTIKFQVYNYTGELNISLPDWVQVNSWDSANYGTIKVYEFSNTRFNQFLSLYTGGIISHLLHHGADDDIYDNIPALLEEATQVFKLASKLFPANIAHHRDIEAINTIIEQVNTGYDLDAKFQPIDIDSELQLEGQDFETIFIRLRHHDIPEGRLIINLIGMEE